jgi:hypothetical protein
MSERDPKRWLDPDAPEGAPLRRLLEAGRAERPSTAQLRALAERLGPPFDGGDPGGGDGSATGGEGSAAGSAAAATSATVAPLAGFGMAAAVALALGGAWSLRGGASGPPAQAAPPVSAQVVAHSPSPPPSEQAVAPERNVEDPSAAALLPPATTEVRAPSARSASKPRDGTARATAELELLERAQRFLPRAPAQALAAVEAHEQRYPESQFAQERESIAVEALLALEQPEQARLRGERFLARYPGSVHARKVRLLIAQRPAPAAPADAAVVTP